MKTKTPAKKKSAPLCDSAAVSGCEQGLVVPLRDAAVTFAMARAEFLAAKRARNSHQCEHEWRDRSGNGKSEPPCRFEGNLEPQEMCEPCQARAKDEEIVQAKSKIASKAWRRFSAILRHNVRQHPTAEAP